MPFCCDAQVLEDSRAVLIAADVPPDGPFPQDEKLKDGGSSMPSCPIYSFIIFLSLRFVAMRHYSLIALLPFGYFSIATPVTSVLVCHHL